MSGDMGNQLTSLLAVGGMALLAFRGYQMW